MIHVVVVAGLTNKEADYGGLGPALGIGGVLEDGGLDRGKKRGIEGSSGEDFCITA